MPRPGAVIVSLNGGVGNQLFQYAPGGRSPRSNGRCRCRSFPVAALAGRALDVPDLVDDAPTFAHAVRAIPVRSVPEDRSGESRR